MAAPSLVRTCRSCGVPIRTWRFCASCIKERRKQQGRARASVPKKCAVCAKPFLARTHTKRPNAYCSTSCGSKAQRARAFVPCPKCGVEFWPWKSGKHARKFCSRKCAIPPKRPRQPFKRQPAAKEQRQCRWCGAPFMVFVRKERKYCSKKHQLIAKSRRRKAILRGLGGELPSVWDIYSRDKGRCHICRKKVPRTAVWPDQRCASLDHVIPITKGGRDEATNVRLAHLGCNQRKQAHIDTLF